MSGVDTERFRPVATITENHAVEVSRRSITDRIYTYRIAWCSTHGGLAKLYRDGSVACWESDVIGVTTTDHDLVTAPWEHHPGRPL